MNMQSLAIAYNYNTYSLQILKTEKKLWPSAQAENCRLALSLKRLDTPGLDQQIPLLIQSVQTVRELDDPQRTFHHS